MKNKKLVIILAVLVIGIAAVIYFLLKQAKITVPVATIPLGSDTPAGTTSSNATNTGTPAMTTATRSWYDDFVDEITSIWTPKTGSPSLTYNVAAFPLKQGSRGEEVKNVQAWLNDHVIVPYALLTVDGIWGDKTNAAVQRTLNTTQVTEAWYKLNVLKITM